MTPSILTPADDFVFSAQNPSLLAWCRPPAPEEMECFAAHGRSGTDFAKIMAAYGISPVMFIRAFEEEPGCIHRCPLWLLGEAPGVDNIPALRFLDRLDPREVVHLAARQSLQLETFLRWHHKRPEKLKNWLAN